MSPFRLVPAAVLAAALLHCGATEAQTADGRPTASASPGLAGTPRPMSRSAPGVGTPRASRGDAVSGSAYRPPKPSAADRAEQKKLEHDLKICIGC